MKLTEEELQEVNDKVEDTFLNEFNSKNFIKACVFEHYEKEALDNREVQE